LHSFPKPKDHIIVVSGGFDPIHSGHLDLFRQARELGDYLLVGINSDHWLGLKKGRNFQSVEERIDIVQSMEMVDIALAFDDKDGTACKLLDHVRKIYPDNKITFANGGDRKHENVPEVAMIDINFAWGVGGDNKKNSSSELLDKWGKRNMVTQNRPWGYWTVHRDLETSKVKELVVDPRRRLSMQRHDKRSEHWFVAQGVATLYGINVSSDAYVIGKFQAHDIITIEKGDWHMLQNDTDEVLRIIEIQFGEECIEEDIERIDSISIIDSMSSDDLYLKGTLEQLDHEGKQKQP
jgi:cytidyltransferase-like protein